MNPVNYISRLCPRHSKTGRQRVGFRCCCEELARAWLHGKQFGLKLYPLLKGVKEKT